MEILGKVFQVGDIVEFRLLSKEEYSNTSGANRKDKLLKTLSSPPSVKLLVLSETDVLTLINLNSYYITDKSLVSITEAEDNFSCYDIHVCKAVREKERELVLTICKYYAHYRLTGKGQKRLINSLDEYFEYCGVYTYNNYFSRLFNSLGLYYEPNGLMNSSTITVNISTDYSQNNLPVLLFDLSSLGNNTQSFMPTLQTSFTSGAILVSFGTSCTKYIQVVKGKSDDNLMLSDELYTGEDLDTYKTLFINKHWRRTNAGKEFLKIYCSEWLDYMDKLNIPHSNLKIEVVDDIIKVNLLLPGVIKKEAPFNWAGRRIMDKS